MKKRIAFLTTQFAEVKSGPGRFTEYLRQWDEAPFEIHFFSEQVVEPSACVHPVKTPAWIRKLPFSWLPKAWMYRQALLHANQKLKFDYVLSADYSQAIFLPQTMMEKLWVMVNDDNYLLIFTRQDHAGSIQSTRKWARRIGYFFERRVARLARTVVSNSLYTKELVERVYKIPAAKSVLLYKAVDLSAWQYLARPARPPRKFVFIKNDWRRGGLDLILSAFVQCGYQHEIEFTIAGISDQQKAKVELAVAESGFVGTTVVKGLQNKAELKALLANADVWISMSWQEALGVSCMEAMACGIPVIASNAGGLKEVLAFGEAGFMVTTGDTSALISVLQQIDKQPDLLNQKAIFARNHVAQFSLDRMYQNLTELFSEASGPISSGSESAGS